MNLKDIKKKFLLDTATNLFLSRGIECVTIEDIAKEANVGEMTIYRYFGKKQNIVFLSLMNLQESVSKDFFKVDIGKTGFEKMSIFYNSYLDIFMSRTNYYRFIREFDSLVMGDDSKNLQEYEDGLSVFKKVYEDIYKLGINDKTIKNIEDLDIFYYTTTHALIELCKKLSYDQAVVPQDLKIQKEKEIKCLINTFLTMLKNS